ncbi:MULTISPECIES: alpha/beta hydrolase [unclassified Streptomyces]|uniref:alpha/beta hydrolase n=1 Tax=unclassified Streptomyces TaxID=2593676 RepID=UPI002E2C8DCE|nr:alpha/beta hydrolase [Streptomyces sp. NBC_01429]
MSVTDAGQFVDRFYEEWGERTARALAALEASGTLGTVREDYDAFLSENFPAPAGVSFATVDVAGLAAEWATPQDRAPGRVLLYLHGGAYLVGGPGGYHGLVGAFARDLRARALVPDYRLAPEAPFPAAIQDGVAAYRWLLDQGVDAGDIVVAGDSAGGAMAVSVLVAARDEGLPMPAASIAFSPWANLEHTGASMTTRNGIDPSANREGLHRAATAFLAGTDPSHPLASPVFADTRGLPPVLIQIGEREVMLSDAIRLAARLADTAVATRLDVAPGMAHVWHLFAGRHPAADKALADAVAFAKEHLR